MLRGGQVELLGSDVQDWTITFVHTGLDSPIGERLRRVRRHVENEEMFLANYADVLTDMPLNDMIDEFKASDAVGSLVAVPPQSAFHCVEVDDEGRLTGIRSLQQLPLYENGGYFVLRPEIFDHLPENGDLITRRLHAAGRAGPDAGLPAPRLLAPGGHRQGAHRPGGPLPVRHQPLDALGDQAPARPAAGGHRRARRRRPPAPPSGSTNAGGRGTAPPWEGAARDAENLK